MGDMADKTVVWWLGRLGPETVPGYKNIFELFMRWMEENGGEFADMSPDDLVNYMEEAPRKGQYALLDKVQEYIGSLKGIRYRTMRKRYSVIRSFFAHNRAALPEDPNFIIRADIPPVKATLTIEEVKEIVLTSTPVYRAVFLSMFQSGMGSDEFEYWNFHGLDSFQNDLEKNARFITVDLPGRKAKKNVKPYSTFIGEDAKDAIIEYLPHRKKARKTFDRIEKLRRDRVERKGEEYIERKFEPNAIFYNNWGRSLTKKALKLYWFRRTIRLGMVKPIGNGSRRNRYGKHIHEMRSLLRSQWEKSPANKSVVEYMMGHTVDPLDYNKAFKDTKWVHGELRKALPMLNIMSSTRPFGLVDKEEYASDLEEMQEKLRRAQEEIERLKKEQSDNSTIAKMQADIEELKRKLREEGDSKNE